ncbi:MAG: LITAF-like zinc ribbon domain-containing protein [Deltaproteobacteria bacterium]|nr:LITAF-like zinc ribbon domain-containing protein [Deltaproteobacteria bacterium]
MKLEEEIIDSVECRECHSRMELLRVKKHPGRWPLVLMISGVACCLFFVGALIGIPLLLLGIYTATAKETMRHCPNCGHYFKVWVQAE